MRRSAENKLRVVAVRVDGNRTALAGAGRSARAQAVVFLQRMIEDGISAMEEIWLPPQTLAKVRSGDLPELMAEQNTISDLFDLEDADTR